MHNVDDRPQLRAQMGARRNALIAAQRIAAAEGVARHLEQLPEFMVDPMIAGYWAVRGEVPLNLAVAKLAARDQRYFLPVLDAAPRSLRFAEFNAHARIAPNRFGIPEPLDTAVIDARQLDVVLVPLLAFDRRGNRLGTGGGFYDTTFAFLRDRARPLLVGVGYAFQEMHVIQMQTWDVALDYVATEKELIACETAETE